jgi:hypothetical protein
VALGHCGDRFGRRLVTVACSAPPAVAPPAVGPLVDPLPDPTASGAPLTLREFGTIRRRNPTRRLHQVTTLTVGPGSVTSVRLQMARVAYSCPTSMAECRIPRASRVDSCRQPSIPTIVGNRIFYTLHAEEGPALNSKVPQTKVPDPPFPQNPPAQPGDLRFGADSHGELYILSKVNGKI